jgi:hypothetical protein
MSARVQARKARIVVANSVMGRRDKLIGFIMI